MKKLCIIAVVLLTGCPGPTYMHPTASGEKVAQDSQECYDRAEAGVAAGVADREAEVMRSRHACMQGRGYSCFPLVACPTL
jgi:hypothetical protein